MLPADKLAACGGLMSVSMPIVAARESYFEAGLEILADTGFGGLKLAEVCSRLGVTSGSFYHYFTNWGAYTQDLIEYWRQDRTVRVIEVIRSQPSPRKRIEAIIATGLTLPHSAEVRRPLRVGAGHRPPPGAGAHLRRVGHLRLRRLRAVDVAEGPENVRVDL